MQALHPPTAVERPPINLYEPDIVGTAQIGKTLTATRGTWLFVGTRRGSTPTTYTYQWLRDGDPILGAFSSTYEPRPPILGPHEGDVGFRISVRVTAHKPGSSPVSATSAKTAPVQEGVLTPSRPKVTGTNRVGELLILETGFWSPGTFGFTFTWYANSVVVREDACNNTNGGCSGSEYSPTFADVGKQIRVVVTAVAPGYKPASRRAYAGFTKPAT